MKSLLMLAAILATLQIGHTLNCNKCNNCEATKNMHETCRNLDPLDNKVAVCLTQVVRVAGSVEPMTIRKCATSEKNVLFQCQELPNTIAVSCNICTSDYCNAAPSITLSSKTLGWMLLLTMAASGWLLRH